MVTIHDITMPAPCGRPISRVRGLRLQVTVEIPDTELSGPVIRPEPMLPPPTLAALTAENIRLRGDCYQYQRALLNTAAGLRGIMPRLEWLDHEIAKVIHTQIDILEGIQPEDCAERLQ